MFLHYVDEYVAVAVQNGAELTIICEPTTASDSVTKLRLLIGTPGTPRARDAILH